MSEVVDCRHCGGTGICGRAQQQLDDWRVGEYGKRYRYRCDVCGTGLEGNTSGRDATVPTCSVCRGVGSVRL
ncbi:hypothetical protein [Nocardia acidivorans]|uniref:hypothetical protein n=1 Tax=Nocardia acidivorans TaxID=404580 RepID=UPI000AD82708|nr:hypothetical protein [Nocardia acidivorans]